MVFLKVVQGSTSQSNAATITKLGDMRRMHCLKLCTLFVKKPPKSPQAGRAAPALHASASGYNLAFAPCTLSLVALEGPSVSYR